MTEETEQLMVYALVAALIAAASWLGIRTGRKEIRFGYERWFFRRILTPKVTPPPWLAKRLKYQWVKLPPLEDPIAIPIDFRYIKQGGHFGLSLSYSSVSTDPNNVEQYLTRIADDGWSVKQLGKRRYECRKGDWLLTIEPWTKRDLSLRLWWIK